MKKHYFLGTAAGFTKKMRKTMRKSSGSAQDLIDLYDYKKEMEDILNQLEQTVNYFNINIPLDSINNKILFLIIFLKLIYIPEI